MERYLLLAYFLFLLITLLVRTRIVQGPWLFLFRAFFPNWKFYHAVGYVPHLWIRYQTDGHSWLPWSRHYPRKKRQLKDLFFNPIGNIQLAKQNLVDHWCNDLVAAQEVQPLNPLVSQQLVERMVRLWVANDHPFYLVSRYQFQLRLEKTDVNGNIESQVVFTSEELSP